MTSESSGVNHTNRMGILINLEGEKKRKRSMQKQ
jgi:hypothetical protein